MDGRVDGNSVHGFIRWLHDVKNEIEIVSGFAVVRALKVRDGVWRFASVVVVARNCVQSLGGMFRKYTRGVTKRMSRCATPIFRHTLGCAYD